ncbi:hypothetical protein L917_14060 [Phytophthora nicotianae]|uniref:Protein argonaute N-terminal domain-containing protein n=1 Tax=Phytophthora nicotianae TaxID=4792 RepID=W2KQ84_PHYNI|nr:hypothetical protein L917_14060 [Phytophthora nicotianae]
MITNMVEIAGVLAVRHSRSDTTITEVGVGDTTKVAMTTIRVENTERLPDSGVTMAIIGMFVVVVEDEMVACTVEGVEVNVVIRALVEIANSVAVMVVLVTSDPVKGDVVVKMIGVLGIMMVEVAEETMNNRYGGGNNRRGDDGPDAALEVSSKDPEMPQVVEFCSRPVAPARSGNTTPLMINYFKLTIDKGPLQIFKYHVTVDLSHDDESKYGPAASKQEGDAVSDVDAAKDSIHSSSERPPRPLQRGLVSRVVNAVQRQCDDDFDGVRVVNDGMAALYSPTQIHGARM